ncbi:MAG: LamG-like jellyroll fold domain-containing protein, partial [Planctomycetota bacterium]
MSKKLISLIDIVVVLSMVLVNSAEAVLVGWWKLDAGAGTVAVDSSGNGYDGAITDATWETGQYGSALGFAGSGYVELPAEAWSTIEMQASFTFWAYGDPAAQPQANFIFGAFQEAGNNESRVMSAHVPWSNGNVYFDTGGTTAGGYDRIQKAATAEEYAGSWQHWALIKNAETGDQQIYLNGELWHGGTGMTRPMTGVTAFTIGAKPQITNFYMGMMDDVRLYDHVLTEDELQAVLAGAGAGFPLAMSPDPKDGAMLEATWANLTWRPGSFAVTHDFYFGTSFDDVNDGAEGTFIGNLATNFQVVGFAGFPAAEGLQPGTTYYWRVDEVNDANAASPWKGEVWSFWVPPKKAYEPSPADGAGFIDESVELSWTPGFGATLQYVYFGENFEDVNT